MATRKRRAYKTVHVKAHKRRVRLGDVPTGTSKRAKRIQAGAFGSREKHREGMDPRGEAWPFRNKSRRRVKNSTAKRYHSRTKTGKKIVTKRRKTTRRKR